MKKQYKNKPLLVIIGFMVLGGVVIVSVGSLLFQYIKHDMLLSGGRPREHYHTIPENPHFQEIWTQSIFVECMTCVITANDSVYFAGTLQNNSPMSLNRLDLLTGEVQWQTTLSSARAALLTYNSEYILVSTPGGKVASPNQGWDTARIVAYDSVTGDQVWSERIPGTRGISTAYFLDKSVHALGGYDRAFQLVSETGQVLNETRMGLLASQDEQANYFVEFDGLRAVDSNTGETLWFYEGSVYPPPQFVEEIIVAGGGQRNLLGNAVALDRRSGDLLWKYENVISNIAINDTFAFFLKTDARIWGREYFSDAQLLAVDIKTGVLIASLEFDPPGLTSGSGNFLYNVAVHDNTLLVHLADGRQLVALRFSPGK